MPDQKLDEAIKKALSLLDEASRTESSDDNSAGNYLWKSAAEAEYIAFRISATRGLFDYDDTEKPDELGGDVLEKARSHLLEIRASIDRDPRGAYSAARRAVSLLRRYDVSRRRSKDSSIGDASPKNG